MKTDRREFLKTSGMGAAAVAGVTPWAPAPEAAQASLSGPIFDVRKYGAAGDGKTIDTPAVNRAIAAAAAAGGGVVRFPAGAFLCYSIHLKSNLTLLLDPGSAIVAGETPKEGTATGGYDAAEPNPAADEYQDFGHTHFHNSLIWGEGLHDVAIVGRGLIWGKGLTRGVGGGMENIPPEDAPGVGDKSIALKNCRNVLLRDFAILQGGHFGLLATGVDNLTLDNLTIDTNRDGIDLDCCKNVRVSNCSINSPWDDALVPKSSYALGYPSASENITITNCYVTGAYELGTLLDGTRKKFPPERRVHRTGRIKFGTESNAGFKNITVSNCVFEGCDGIALESVDGALLEDVTFTGITMRDISRAPLFLRLGSRMRGPRNLSVGVLRRVILSNIVSSNSASQLCAIISGIPGHAIEDIKISDVYLHHQGGGTREMAELQPEEFADKYPEPSMFGAMPAHGFFIRHAKNLEFSNVEIAYEKPDQRPAVVIEDAVGADFFRLKTPAAAPGRVFSLRGVADFRTLACRGVPDVHLARVEQKTL
jgi:polygalacturonase